MKQKWQAPFRRMLALLLCVASLLGMFPALTMVTKAVDSSIIPCDYRDYTTAVTNSSGYYGYTRYIVYCGTALSEIYTEISGSIKVFKPGTTEIMAYHASDSGYYKLTPPTSSNITTTVNAAGKYQFRIVSNTNSSVIGYVDVEVIYSSTASIEKLGQVNKTVNTSSDQFYLQLIKHNGSINQNSMIAIASQYGNYIMRYDPAQSSAQKSTGSFVKDQDYLLEGEKIYMDHSLRNEALWIFRQHFANSSSKPSDFSSLLGDNQSSAVSFGTSTRFGDVQGFFRNPFIASVHLQKGKASGNNSGFWYNNGGDAAAGLYRHLYVRSNSAPFAAKIDYNTAYTQELTQYVIEIFNFESQLNAAFFYYRAGGAEADMRFLQHENGIWSVALYNTTTGFTTKDQITTKLNQIGAKHRLYLYSYVRDTQNKKQLAYSGNSIYNVDVGTSLASLQSTIRNDISVTDATRTSLEVPEATSSADKSKAGYYWIDGIDQISTSSAGTYTLTVKYNSLINDQTATTDTLGTITVNVRSMSVNADSCGAVSKNAGKSSTVYAADSSGNVSNQPSCVNITINGVNYEVPITLGMLTSGGKAVNTSTPGPQSVKLTYNGTTYDYSLTVHDTTLAEDIPVYPAPGSVAVGKEAITSQDDFTASGGKATIELSVKGKNSTLGVDLVVVFDLSSSMKYAMNENSTDHVSATNPSRLTVMKNALLELVDQMQADNLDVRIAMADFGDLDHYEFKKSVLDTAHPAWPQIETKNGKDGSNYGGTAVGEKFYSVTHDWELPNQLNFILGLGDKEIPTGDSDNSQPFYLHPYKYDHTMSAARFTGKLLPNIYTRTNPNDPYEISANAFVDVDGLTDTVMDSILGMIDQRAEMMLGTNYDVGLEYAYRLAYARKQQNIAEGLNREISCIFISDGAAMQYNYFSGRSQSDAWSRYLVGDTDEILTNNINATTGAAAQWDLDNPSTLHPAMKWLLARMNKMMHQGKLWVANTDGASPNGDKSGQIGIWGGSTDNGHDTYWSGNTTCSCYQNAMTGKDYSSFRNNFSGHNTKDGQGTTLYWADIMEILEDNLSNPALYAAPNPFGTSADGSTTIFDQGVFIRTLREPSYTDGNDFVVGSSPSNWIANPIKGSYTFTKNEDGTWTIQQPPQNGRVDNVDFVNTLYNERHQYQTYSPYWYFYNQDGRNWWAEAIKGDSDKVYPVINRHIKYNDDGTSYEVLTSANAEQHTWNTQFDERSWKGQLYQGEVSNKYTGSVSSGSLAGNYSALVPDYMSGKDYIAGFQGLGMNIYTIGFAITADDNQISVDEATTVLKNIASSPSFFYTANSVEQLEDALDAIVVSATAGASKSWYTDTMGEHFELDISAGSVLYMKRYSVDANGNRGEQKEIMETIEFTEVNGEVVAYLNGDTSKNILGEDGILKGHYICYNTNFDIDSTVAVTNIKGTAQTYNLPGRTFFWAIGDVLEDELVLEYTVFLTQRQEKKDIRPNVMKPYDTNTSAAFHYVDDNGNSITVEKESPSYLWKETAKVNYQFYLVDQYGQPITANGTDTTVAGAALSNSPTSVTLSVSETNAQTTYTLVAQTLFNSYTGVSNFTQNYVLYNSSASVAVVSQRDTQYHDVNISNDPTTYIGTDKSFDGNNRELETEVVYFAVMAVKAYPDTVVVDYGLPVIIDILANDMLPGTNTINGYYKPSELGVAVNTSGTATSEIDDSYATVVTENGKSKWTGKNMQFSNYYQYGYHVTNTNNSLTNVYTSTVTVIPATSIYYEDSFVTFDTSSLKTSGWSLASWSTANGTAGTTQNQDRPGNQGDTIDHNKVYGYDDAYASTTTYSGSARWAQVSAKNPARAYFTFTGTGFDVISYTSNTTGAIVAYVYEGVVTKFDDPSTDMILDTTTWDYVMENGVYKNWEGQVTNGQMVMPIKNIAVDSYYSAGSLYQVPVLKCENLTYGTYTVEILVAYDKWFDRGQNGGGAFDFYLDSIRIYNPAGVAGVVGSNGKPQLDSVISGAYVEDGEGWPRYQELRNMLIAPNADSEDLIVNSSQSGMLFIDKGDAGTNEKPTYQEYKSWGPNNEVYLTTSQALTFTLNVQKYLDAAFSNSDFSGDVAKVQIAMRSLTGNSQVTVKAIGVDDLTCTLSTTAQYFDITAFKDKAVTLDVTGDNNVSITNIKVTHTSMPNDYLKEVGQAKSAGASEQQDQILNLNAPSMASLLTVDNDMALEALDQLNKELAAPAKLTPKYASLSFKDLIHTNIYFTADKLSGINAENLGLAVFADNAVDGTVDTASYVVNGATLVDGMYKVSTKGIPAKNLGDTIYFKVFAREADGSYTYSKLMAYSPVEYANFLISSGSDMDKALAAAMLNYGAEAQKYFGYNTEALMNANVTEEAKALLNAYSIDDLDALVPMDESKTGVFTDNGDFGQKYPTVSFKGAFSINFYVQPAEAVDGDVTFYYWTQDTCSTAAQLTADNADGTAVMAAADGLYSASVDGIFAKDLDKTVYAAAVYQADGVTYCTGILPYSVAEYARSFANTADDFAPFANATGIYGSVAKAYFGS